MKFTAKHAQKADLDSLDELIKMCESSMIKPFSKKKEVEIELSPDESVEEIESDTSEIDLSDIDKDELLELYMKMQQDKD